MIDLQFLVRLRAQADEIRRDLAAREATQTHEEVMAATRVPLPVVIYKQYEGDQLPLDTNNEDTEPVPFTDEQMDVIASVLAQIQLGIQTRVEDATLALRERVTVLEGKLDLLANLLGTKSFEASERVISTIRIP
jgi:hypothetical protein